MKKVVITVISVLVLLFIVFLFGGIYLTHKLISDKTGILITAAENETPQKFNYSEIDTLPPVLQKYFRFALEDGITKPRFLRLKQKGEFKTSISADFRDIEAQQYFLTSKPGFLWHGKIYLTSFLWLDGIDTYFNGDGALLIKFLSGISMTRETGDEIKQAQIVRWLLEAAWFPAALLPNENLKWIKYDSTSATLLFNEKDIEIKARFFFNGNGSLKKVTTQRYMTTSAGPVLTNYSGYYSDYKTYNGITVPSHLEAEWNLDNQDFRYGKFTVTGFEYDNFSEFE